MTELKVLLNWLDINAYPEQYDLLKKYMDENIILTDFEEINLVIPHQPGETYIVTAMQDRRINIIAGLCPLTDELEQLRKEKEIWLKICKSEKERWMNSIAVFPGLISEAEKDHVKNLNQLLGE